MTPLALPILLLPALFLALTATAAFAGDWNARGKIAQATTYATTDRQPATVEVDCRREPRVRLVHPYLTRLPVRTDDSRPGWRGIVLLTNGWGLDLTRPGHQGVRSVWFPCNAARNCLSARDTVFTIRMLRESWTWFVRLDAPGHSVYDIRFSLVGSRAAIDQACAPEISHRSRSSLGRLRCLY